MMNRSYLHKMIEGEEGSVQFQSSLNTIYPFIKRVEARGYIGEVAVKFSNLSFKAAHTLFDFTHIVRRPVNLLTDMAKMLKDNIIIHKLTYNLRKDWAQC